MVAFPADWARCLPRLSFAPTPILKGMFHWPPFCPYQGTLERGGGRTTHQLFGTQGSHSRDENISWSRHTGTTPDSGQPFFTSCPSKNGQYNRCGLCEQEGGTQSPYSYRVDASDGRPWGHGTSQDIFALRLNDQLLCRRDFQTLVLQQWMPFHRTGANERVLSTHQWCYCLEFFRKW